MLSTITKTMRFKAAIFLAVLYAFTVIAPHAAMAFGNAQGAAHCLTVESANTHDHGQTSHKHTDGVEHTHAAPQADGQDKSSDDKGPAAACCGLFSCSAMLTETRGLSPGPVTASTVTLPLPDLVDGQGPARINRPPIA
jgi:ABC-type nickel/cobalt efflux system permease component RcnA